MKRVLIAAAMGLPLFASAATNLLSNGSFESGLSTWTVAGGGVYAPTAITYGPPGSAFGEVVPAASDLSLSPDAVGANGLYFVDDNSSQTLTQSFVVAEDGTYAVGFDTYATANGYRNPNNAGFSAKVDAVSVLTTLVGSLPSTTWQAQTGNLFLAAGTHEVTFTFSTTGGQSKDLVIDRVYVTAAVPEPETYGLMLSGLALVGWIARRRQPR